MKNTWTPPFFLFVAGRQQTASRNYFNDVSETPLPRRLLIKHTLSGEGVLYINNTRRILEAGSIFVIERPGPYRYCYEGSGTPWIFEFFSIGINGPMKILPSPLSSDPIMFLRNHPELQAKLNDLINLRLKPDYKPDLHHSLLSYAFVMNYISARLKPQQQVPAVVLELQKQLDESSSTSLNISHCCMKLGYTPEALIRLFKKNLGITPGQYLQNRRLAKVCDLLSESSLSIKEIAHICGFNSQNYLGRIFKHTLGVTPGHYRNNPNLQLLELLDLKSHRTST
jgi:AraC-like DNA-binding protein